MLIISIFVHSNCCSCVYLNRKKTKIGIESKLYQKIFLFPGTFFYGSHLWRNVAFVPTFIRSSGGFAYEGVNWANEGCAVYFLTSVEGVVQWLRHNEKYPSRLSLYSHFTIRVFAVSPTTTTRPWETRSSSQLPIEVCGRPATGRLWQILWMISIATKKKGRSVCIE